MKYPLLVLSLLFIITGCNKGERFLNSRPQGVVSEEAMIEVLVDINLAESALRVGDVQRTSSSDSLYQKSQFLEVFEKNGITPDEFRKSISYYSQNIAKLEDIYSEVVDRLNQMDAELKDAAKSDTAKTTKKIP